MSTPLQARAARKSDRPALQRLLRGANHVHIHPDWQSPLSWLGQHPFQLATDDGQVIAALVATPDPADTSWVRVAAVDNGYAVTQALGRIWPATRAHMQTAGVQRVAALVRDPWLADVVTGWGMTHLCFVVGLRRLAAPFTMPLMPTGIQVRRAATNDIVTIVQIDNAAFAPPWQHSRRALLQAFNWSDYSTVITVDGQIAGYQMSTGARQGGHLARLAVLPGAQGCGLGRLLVADVVRHYEVCNAPYVTVNTQDVNTASLRLYRALGFGEIDERYPVFMLDEI